MSARFYPDHSRYMLLREWTLVELDLVRLKPTHPVMVARQAEWTARARVSKKGIVDGFLLPGSLDWVVPRPPGEITLERVVRQDLAGRAGHTDRDQAREGTGQSPQAGGRAQPQAGRGRADAAGVRAVSPLFKSCLEESSS